MTIIGGHPKTPIVASMGLGYVFWGDTCGGVCEFAIIDTCGGVCEFAIIAFEFSGGRPSRGSPLKIGTAYFLGIFFGCDFFSDFFADIFLSLK